MEKTAGYGHNSIKTDFLEGFADIRGSFKEHSRGIYFVRILGWSSELCGAVREMDKRLTEEMKHGNLFYHMVNALPNLLPAENTRYYTQRYEHLAASGYTGIGKPGEAFRQPGAALQEIISVYCAAKPSVTDSMRRNFAVKILFWLDFVLKGIKQQKGNGCVKIAARNVTKVQEYLFYYFLALTGCDVLLLQSRQDIQGEEMQKFSKAVRAGEFCMEEIPAAEGGREASEENRQKPAVKIPQRVRRRSTPQLADTAPQHPADTSVRHPGNTHAVLEHPGQPALRGMQPRREKSFEELAALSSSVVMIAVRDKEGEVISTGSGIMAGRGGYILTNDHVARGGYSYSVRIENDSVEYQTDELIKYNPVLDLALLRIDRRLSPLEIYHGDRRLVRGQSVAAIGSPLGLFNSVSDGIISGFRNLNGVDMIQFTAPISSGSSGGALLNRYGEVIGISTAGFDRGQNINLAVGYENIRLFLQGFL